MRRISESEHTRLLKALEHLQTELENYNEPELASKIKSSKADLESAHIHYKECISRLGLIVKKYHKTFKETHEDYIQLSRMCQKAVNTAQKNAKSAV